MINYPADPEDKDALRRWMAAPEAQIFLKVLRAHRIRTLENLSRMPDEVTLRMHQGHAQILADVIDLFNRTP